MYYTSNSLAAERLLCEGQVQKYDPIIILNFVSCIDWILLEIWYSEVWYVGLKFRLKPSGFSAANHGGAFLTKSLYRIPPPTSLASGADAQRRMCRRSAVTTVGGSQVAQQRARRSPRHREEPKEVSGALLCEVTAIVTLPASCSVPLDSLPELETEIVQKCSVKIQTVSFGERRTGSPLPHQRSVPLDHVSADILQIQSLVLLFGVQGSGLINGLYLPAVSGTVVYYPSSGWPASSGDPLSVLALRGYYRRHVGNATCSGDNVKDRVSRTLWH